MVKYATFVKYVVTRVSSMFVMCIAFLMLKPIISIFPFKRAKYCLRTLLEYWV